MYKIAFGTYRLEGENCYNSVKNALKVGYRSIDTATLYENHNDVGRAINDAMSEYGIDRSEICVSSKIHRRDQKSNNVYSMCQQILGELNLEYLDILLLHQPIKTKHEQSWRDLERAVNNNLVKKIGTSNFNIQDLSYILDISLVKPYINQYEMSIYCQQTELTDFCKKNNILIQAHSCLTFGKKMKDDKILKLCDKYGINSANLMIN